MFSECIFSVKSNKGLTLSVYLTKGCRNWSLTKGVKNEGLSLSVVNEGLLSVVNKGSPLMIFDDNKKKIKTTNLKMIN